MMTKEGKEDHRTIQVIITPKKNRGYPLIFRGPAHIVNLSVDELLEHDITGILQVKKVNIIVWAITHIRKFLGLY